MAEQGKQESAQSPFASITLSDFAIKDKLLAAKEELLKEGVITETFGNRLEEFTRKADLGIRIRVPRDLLSAKLVKLNQMEDFSWANKLLRNSLGAFHNFPWRLHRISNDEFSS